MSISNNIFTDNDICEGVIDALYKLNVSQTIKCDADLINKYNISNLSDLSTKELLLYSLNDALNMFVCPSEFKQYTNNKNTTKLNVIHLRAIFLSFRLIMKYS